MHEALGSIPQHHRKSDVTVHDFNSSSLGVEAGGPEVQVHSELRYMRQSFKSKKTKKKQKQKQNKKPNQTKTTPPMILYPAYFQLLCKNINLVPLWFLNI